MNDILTIYMSAIGCVFAIACYVILMLQRSKKVTGEETGIYCQVHCTRCARLMIKSEQGFISCVNKLCERQGVQYYPPSIRIYRVGEEL